MDYDVMMEIMEESVGLFFLILLLDIALTILAYAAFPILFAKKRTTPILTKAYKRKCFGINAIWIAVFFLLGGSLSLPAYVLWTVVFSNKGLKHLKSRGLLLDAPIVEQPSVQTENRSFYKTSPISYCEYCGAPYEADARFCSECGAKTKENNDDLQ